MPFGYECNGEIFGFVSLHDMGSGVFELNNLAVLPAWRHIGYGKKLLDFCKTKVIELGGNKITIGIVEENTVLKNWYAANGFEHTGTRKFPHQPFTAGFMEWRANP
jgi:ribosomal protein S18 acetylase RimI-like enzyme